MQAMRIDRIYTRGGDAGQTSLGDGERVSKNDLRIWAYGTVDETGAAIGTAVAAGLEPEIAELLGRDPERSLRRRRRSGRPARHRARARQEPPAHHRGARGRPRARLRRSRRAPRAARELRPLGRHARGGGAARRPHHLPPGRAPRRRAVGVRAGQPGRAGLPEPAVRSALHPRAGSQTTTAAPTCCGVPAGRWRRRELGRARPRPRAARRARALEHLGGALPDGVRAGRRAASLRPRPGRSRPLPVHARDLRDHVPRQAVDDAPVRGVRHRGGDQPPLPLPARPGPDRPLDRLRHAHADGLRLRPHPLAGRGRARGRRRRHAGRHGGPVRRASRSTASPPR